MAVNWARGLWGLARALVGADQVEPEVRERRLDVCTECPELVLGAPLVTTESLVRRARCGACGCYVVPKAGLASESCPQGRW